MKASRVIVCVCGDGRVRAIKQVPGTVEVFSEATFRNSREQLGFVPNRQIYCALPRFL